MRRVLEVRQASGSVPRDEQTIGSGRYHEGGIGMGFFDRGKRKRRLEEAGVTAPAQIVSVQDTGVTVNNNPRVKLTLAVSPTDGSGPFQVSMKHLVSRVAVPRAGDVFTVRYDPEDHDNFAIESGGTASAA